MSVIRGDGLLDRLCSGEDDGAANDLLAEVFRAGYPIERLGRLFHCGSEVALRSGAWIVSELGAGAAVLMDEVTALLGNELKYVRFFALDAVLAAATPEHGSAVAAAIGQIEAPESAVRWKVLRLLARVGRDQLAAGSDYLRDDRLRVRVEWLVSAEDGEITSAEVVGALDDRDRLVQLFAAAAAVRLARVDRAALEHAAASTDEEIGDFGREELAARSDR